MLTENDRKLINTRFNVRNTLQKCKQSHRKNKTKYTLIQEQAVYTL